MGRNDQAASVMSSEAMVSFLRKVAPGVEQSLQQNETVDIFQVRCSRYDTKAKHIWLPHRDGASTGHVRETALHLFAEYSRRGGPEVQNG